MSNNELLAKLQIENARLIALLESHRIDWRPSITASPLVTEPSRLSTGDKVALFRRLFRGRSDVYPIRWESKTTGKSGYAPACANEWRAGVCEKPRIKCSDCPNRLLLPLSDAVIYGHLAGEHTVQARQTCASSISSILVTRRCCECGRGASAGIAQWGIVYTRQARPVAWAFDHIAAPI